MEARTFSNVFVTILSWDSIESGEDRAEIWARPLRKASNISLEKSVVLELRSLLPALRENPKLYSDLKSKQGQYKDLVENHNEFVANSDKTNKNSKGYQSLGLDPAFMVKEKEITIPKHHEGYSHQGTSYTAACC